MSHRLPGPGAWALQVLGHDAQLKTSSSELRTTDWRRPLPSRGVPMGTLLSTGMELGLRWMGGEIGQRVGRGVGEECCGRSTGEVEWVVVRFVEWTSGGGRDEDGGRLTREAAGSAVKKILPSLAPCLLAFLATVTADPSAVGAWSRADPRGVGSRCRVIYKGTERHVPCSLPSGGVLTTSLQIQQHDCSHKTPTTWHNTVQASTTRVALLCPLSTHQNVS